MDRRNRFHPAAIDHYHFIRSRSLCFELTVFLLLFQGFSKKITSVLIAICLDFHRNIFKADVGMVRKGQFPMAFIENTSR